MTALDKMLSAADVAKLLGISQTTARKHMRAASAINIGTGMKNESLRISETAFCAYLTRRTASTKGAPVLQPTVNGRTPLTIPRKDWKTGKINK